MNILLLDDLPAHRVEVHRALALAMATDGTVKDFTPGPGEGDDGTYESRLAEDLQKAPNAPIDLIVADRDLSSYRPRYTGLSEATVRRVADALGVPECGYARGERADDPEYIKRGEQSEACIRLPLKPIDEFARRIVAIAKGFQSIASRVRAMPDATKQPPAKLLARILDKPEYADKISLYSSGDKNRLMILREAGASNDKSQRLACLLGYWLWDSVLRFPGVTVGVTPASSYLNILHEEFRDNERIQVLFAAAKYTGPFADAKKPMWWRGMLDDIVAHSGLRDGREFAAKELRVDIPPSQCCEDPRRTAGYYCMINQKPVSAENSKGGLPWFPRGADLARVSKTKLEELGPWL